MPSTTEGAGLFFAAAKDRAQHFDLRLLGLFVGRKNALGKPILAEVKPDLTDVTRVGNEARKERLVLIGNLALRDPPRMSAHAHFYLRE